MEKTGLMKKMAILNVILILTVTSSCIKSPAGQTEITKWQFGKNGAVSIT